MSWVEDAVREFGRGMGLPQLSLPEEGALSLAFEHRGTLDIERGADGGLLVHLGRDHPFASPALLRAALEACHYRARRGRDVQAGLYGDTLVLLVRLKENEVSLPVLEQTLDQLSELHDRLAG